MNNIYSKFREILKQSDFKLTDLMIDQFEEYAKLLLEWNEKINLTAIVDVKEIAIKHFLDSLLVMKVYEIPQGATVIDVGTGAGFPGIPLKIVRPDINLILLDSLKKRLIFLDFLTSSLKIDVNLVHSRAEDAAKSATFRESFDVAVARAVAPLNILLEYCVPFVKMNGVFLALKGSNVNEELKKSQNAQKCLNVEAVDIKKFSLVDENDRSIVVLKKLSKVSNIYPRHSSKISKKPL